MDFVFGVVAGGTALSLTELSVMPWHRKVVEQ